jgi:Holliday junction resolvase RusA-like endonuclease
VDFSAALDVDTHVEPLDSFTVWVPGAPRPWQRAFRQGKRTFTSPEMDKYRQLIFTAWVNAGVPKLHSHHWHVHVEACWVRPDSHFLKDGISLSSIGRKMRYPSYCDLDNILKHIDVFVRAGAVSDDRYAVSKTVTGRWDPQSHGVRFTFGEVV